MGSADQISMYFQDSMWLGSDLHRFLRFPQISSPVEPEAPFRAHLVIFIKGFACIVV